MPAKAKVVLTDYVWESLVVEKKTLEGLADLVPLQTKKPEEFIAQAADCDALLEQADAAMYQAKQSGKSRFVLAGV